jgi:Lon protease-like protein
VRSLHAVGCAAELRAVDPLPDGRLRIITTGSYRFTLEELDALGEAGTAYLTGEVEWLPEPEGADAESLAWRVREAFSAYRTLLRGTAAEPDDGSTLPADPMVLSYAVSAAVLVDLPERQALLETPDTQARLRLLLDLLRRETLLLRQLPSLPAGELAREPFDLN